MGVLPFRSSQYCCGEDKGLKNEDIVGLASLDSPEQSTKLKTGAGLRPATAPDVRCAESRLALRVNK